MAGSAPQPLTDVLRKIHESCMRTTSINEKETDAMREALVSALCAVQKERDEKKVVQKERAPVATPIVKPDPPPYVHSASDMQQETDRQKMRPRRDDRTNLAEGMQVREPCQMVPDSIFDQKNTHLRLGLCNIETLPKRFPPVAHSPRQEKVAPMLRQVGGVHSALQPFAAAICPPAGSFRHKADEKVMHMPYTVFTQPSKLPSMERAYVLGPPRVAAYK